MSSSNTDTKEHKEGTALSRAMRPVNHVVERFIPSSLVFSILLTFIVVVLALLLTETAPGDLIVHWGDGLAGLLDFITQMALILLLGHILANTGPVRAGLGFLGNVPRTELMAYVFRICCRSPRQSHHVGARAGGWWVVSPRSRLPGQGQGSSLALPHAGSFRIRRVCGLAYGLFGLRATHRSYSRLVYGRRVER